MARKQNEKQTRNIVVTSHNIQFLEKIVNGDEEAIKELSLIIEEKKKNSKRVCPICGTVFMSNNFMAKYCDKCKTQTQLIGSKQRRQSVRYLHKRIWDTINNSKKYNRDFLNAFMNESNYYWYTIKGKNCQIKKKEEYLDIRTEEEYKEWLTSKLNELKSKNSELGKGKKKPIRQLTKDGELVAIWDSATAVTAELGFASSNICICCKGKIPTYKGFIWEYADEESERD